MKVETFAEARLAARDKWHEYKNAAKRSNNPLYKDLQKVYYQLKGGKKVIDIRQVIAKGGLHENGHPKLAIAQVESAKVWCTLRSSGSVQFVNRAGRWGGAANPTVEDVVISACYPEQEWLKGGPHYSSITLEAPVPPVPPAYLPEVMTKDLYILWEVDEWKMVPPTDPWLLKRITKTFFVALAAWDLTPLEKAAMAGRMH